MILMEAQGLICVFGSSLELPGGIVVGLSADVHLGLYRNFGSGPSWTVPSQNFWSVLKRPVQP